MVRFVFLFLLFLSYTSADLVDPSVLAATDGDPQITVSRYVNALTGDFVLFQDDHVVPGVEPIVLKRLYVSGDGRGEECNWVFFPHTRLYLDRMVSKKEKRAIVGQPSGTFLAYEWKQALNPNEEIYFPNLKDQGKGITNTAQGVISARNNLKNTRLVKLDKNHYRFTLGDGTVRLYTRTLGVNLEEMWLLESERLPNAHWILYEYDAGGRVYLIKTTNSLQDKVYAWARFHYIEGWERSPNFNIETSDGKTLEYRYVREGDEEKGYLFRLSSIKTPTRPEEQIEYAFEGIDRTRRLNKRIFPQGREVAVEFYQYGKNKIGDQKIKIEHSDDPRYHRVKTLYEPRGVSKELIPTHHFFYHVKRNKTRHSYHYEEDNVTEIVDALGCKTVFRFTSSFYPTSIESYDEKGRHYSTIEMAWNNFGEIERKSILDADKKEISTREFSYDEHGNVIEERFIGDLTGLGAGLGVDLGAALRNREIFSTKTTYNTEHLPVRVEKSNGLVVLYAYLADTPLMTAQYECNENTILKREFREYDGDNLLVRTIRDDGSSLDRENLTDVTYRNMTSIRRRTQGSALGFPEAIEDTYLDLNTSQEKLIGRCLLHYQHDCKVIRRDIYDREGDFRYSLHISYDDMGRPHQETNPIGQVQTTYFDVFGNPIWQESFSKRLVTKMRYDKANLLMDTEELGDSQVAHTCQFSYDIKGRKISSTDTYNQTTHVQHNPIGSSVDVKLPEVSPHHPSTHKTVDCLGRAIIKVDERGDQTTIRYNAYGNPTLTVYADGSVERRIYALDGTLKEHIDSKGNRMTFLRDVFGREIEKRFYDADQAFLFSETSTYKGEHLICHTDPSGYTVHTGYDGAGRLVREEDGFGCKEYAYDALNRLHATTTSDGKNTLRIIKEYDLLDRVIEERSEDATQHILTKVNYTYDASGNKAGVIRSINGQISQEQFAYDAFNRLINHTDALGHQTTTFYDERFPDNHHQNGNGHRKHLLRVTTKDARGIDKIDTFDALGRLSRIEKKNKDTPLSNEHLFYDAGGALCKQESLLISQGQFQGQSQGQAASLTTTLWEYGVRGRLLALTRAAGTQEERTTRYTYDLCGLLVDLIKPDGIILHHAYDALGRKVRLSSSDHSVDYRYLYDEVGRITSLENCLTHQRTWRRYDKRGALLAEELEHGAQSTYTYDTMGRRTGVLLCDGSAISYDYDAYFLRQVNRLDRQGAVRYFHSYAAYDESGHLIKEDLAGHIGEQVRRIDLLGRTTEISSPFFRDAVLEYDAVGNVLSRQTSTKTSRFAYDELSQLTQENDSTYAYDSHHNRLRQDQDLIYSYNTLDEVISVGESFFVYDLSGNPISEEMLKGTIEYRYDALDRLVEVTFPEHYRLSFTYDGMHRRMCKNTHRWEEGRWVERGFSQFLYDGDNEIGAISKNNQIVELRILGHTAQAERGAAIAIELGGDAFIPQHDLVGNVTKLIPLNGFSLGESYEYTAFGQKDKSKHNIFRNPWRYQSKRVDDETGLVYFGRRYYIPSLGRWLTTDPKGYTALSSLYAFCQNNPLIRFDLYGLEDLKENEANNPSFFESIWSSVVSFAKGAYALVADNTQAYQVNALPTGSSGKIGFGHINGMFTSTANALKHAEILSEYAGGAQVDLIYSGSHIITDIPKAIWAFCGGSTEAEELLKENWRDYFRDASFDALYVQMCTSRGCAELKNALESSPVEIRNRVVVIAISPAKIIDDKICRKAYNYASRRDFVPMLDIVGNIKYGDQVINLEPHPKASLFLDHTVISPTFAQPIKYHSQQPVLSNTR